MERARRLTIACFAAALSACGDGGDAEVKADAGGAPGVEGSAPFDLEGCVVSVLATDCASGLSAPHSVELLNARTGQPLPGFRTTSAIGGKYEFKNVPGDVEIAVHAIGAGPVDQGASTYDSIAYYTREAGDNLLRLSSVGTAGLAGMAAGFTPADERVALTGAVYQVNDSGRRVGTVGCAQIYLDDQPHPALAVDQRYSASNGIPTALTRLDKTLAGSGRFYFGNLTTGEHTLKVSLDNGQTFIAQRSVLVTRARKDAESPFKALLYLVAIDVKGPNPTPMGCPTEESM